LRYRLNGIAAWIAIAVPKSSACWGIVAVMIRREAIDSDRNRNKACDEAGVVGLRPGRFANVSDRVDEQ
jgi:hypothetical protein